MMNRCWLSASLLILVLVLAQCAWSVAPAPLTPQAARAVAGQAVEELIALNQEISEEHFHTGEWERTIAAQERITALEPVGIEAYALAGWLLWSTKQHERAIDCYHRMVAANPQNPQAYYEFGYYYTCQKNDAEAVKWLETAETLGIPSPKRHLYGHVLERLGRTADALLFWQKVLRATPEDAVAQRQVARLTAE